MVRQIRGSTQIKDNSVPPVKISDQGAGGGLDADKLDGMHAGELLAGAAGVGCLRADGSVPLTADWDVGGHQIKWLLFQRADGSFPADPQEGMPCYRIDLQEAYVYTASGWMLLNWNYIVPAGQFVGYEDESVGHYRADGELVFLDQVAGYKSLEELAAGGGGATVVIQEDDVKVVDASIVNFEGGGGKVTDEGGGKVTVDITPGAGGGEEAAIKWAILLS